VSLCLDRPVGVCRVWWAHPVAPDAAPALVELLDGIERGRLARFRRPADAARYLAAHALTRLVLAAEIGGGAVGRGAGELAFDRTCRCGEQHGKPALPGGPGFSFTHAGDLVGLAVHDGPVGLDVEQERPLPDLAAMAGHACSPAESVADEPAFFRLWTRKEALLKATGEGLASPMTSITLDATGVADWTGPGAPADPVWLRDMHPEPGYPAAVAGLGPAPSDLVEADGNPLLHAVHA
jgi:4'-phosphopantetheinyl transferase